MLCQQLFTSRPIIFIGFSSLASVDRLIYSNSESHLYSLYQKAQPALHLNATLSGAGMWRASKCCLTALLRHSGTCTKECSFGDFFFFFCQNIQLEQEWLQLYLTVLVREDIWED